jgi:hypothetical protein
VDSFERSSTSDEQATIALAYCQSCKARLRVLPCDVLPRKTYSLPIIERTTTDYGAGDRSLRKVAWAVPGDRTPSHTTLHAWTEGLGAFALGRPGGSIPGADPSSRVLSESAARRPGLDTTIDLRRYVDERRYRSEARRERLAATASLLSIAAVVSGTASPNAMTEWRLLALSWSGLETLRFPTGIQCTRIEHVDPRERARSSADDPQRAQVPCRPRSRSPPGDSSRFSP